VGDLTEAFVLDANFFISLAQSREPRAIEAVLAHARGLGWELHTTPRVLDEITTVVDGGTRASARAMAEREMQVGRVDEGAITALRAAIGGPTRAPQDSDLSLMVLAEALAKRGARVRLVSDDFKISTTSRDTGMPYAVISPSVFLFLLSRQLHGDGREEVRKLFRRVRHGEMDYVLSRRDTYNVEEKLTWLMDNLLQTVTTPATLEAGAPGEAAPPSSIAVVAPGTIASSCGDDSVAWAALLRELRGEHVRRGHLAPFKDVMPHLEPLRGLRGALVEVQTLTDIGELEAAVALTHETLAALKGALQLSVGALPRDQGQLVLRAYAEMLPDVEMVAALIHVNLDEFADCEDHLDNVAILSLAAGVSRATIEANYLGALVNTYRQQWAEARAQFELSARLAAQAGDGSTQLRSQVGAAVSRFLAGDHEGAMRAMDEAHARIDDRPAEGVAALEEFGDHFTNFNAMHLAAGLYDEALECAVEVGDPAGAERLLGKLRRSHLSMGLDQRELADALRGLVDHANTLRDDALKARYEALEHSLHESEALLDEPLTDLLPDWSSASWLPPQLRDWLEVVRAEDLPGGEGLLLVCFAPEVGTVGLLTRTRIRRAGIEHAHVRVGDAARVRLVAPPEELRRRHRVRGIVVVREGDPVVIRHDLVRLRE
jgi:hypothetical protein